MYFLQLYVSQSDRFKAIMFKKYVKTIKNELILINCNFQANLKKKEKHSSFSDIKYLKKLKTALFRSIKNCYAGEI